MPKNVQMHHLGVIVDDLDEAVGFYTDVLGLEVVRELDYTATRGAKAAFLACGPIEIELIEITEDEQRRRRLGDQVAKVEHIGVTVDDVDAAFEELAARGIEFTTPAPVESAEFKTFTTTEATSDGVRYQFLEVLAGWRDIQN